MICNYIDLDLYLDCLWVIIKMMAYCQIEIYNCSLMNFITETALVLRQISQIWNDCVKFSLTYNILRTQAIGTCSCSRPTRHALWILICSSDEWNYTLPWEQGSWGQHGAHMWAPCWPHELCYLGTVTAEGLTHIPLHKMACHFADNIFKWISMNGKFFYFDSNFTEVCS